MCQVEQPADFEIVGELLQVLGEVLDRQPRAVGFWCTAAALIGRMQELSPRHRMQFSFSPAQRGHALKEQQRRKILLFLADGFQAACEDPAERRKPSRAALRTSSSSPWLTSTARTGSRLDRTPGIPLLTV